MEDPAAAPAPAPVNDKMVFVKSVRGMLLAGALVCAAICFLCGLIGGVSGILAAIISFVTLLEVGLIYVLHLLNKWESIPAPPTLAFLAMMAGSSLLHLLTAIICSILAMTSPAVGAASFFFFVSAILCGILTFFGFRDWKSAGSPRSLQASSSATSQPDRDVPMQEPPYNQY